MAAPIGRIVDRFAQLFGCKPGVLQRAFRDVYYARAVPVANGPSVTGRQASRGSGVYLADAVNVATSPRQVVIDGKRLSRFMDSIYLDRPCDKLSIKKIQVLNAARRPLLERQEIGAVNSRVRSALAYAVRGSGAQRVLEWGCGYHPLRDLLSGVQYAGLDVDPAVIDANRAMGHDLTMYKADGDLHRIPGEGYDAIVSAFVFHFRLPRLHLTTMRRALAPEGIVLANVYRRSPRARRELIAGFELAGLRVQRVKDTERLCVDHEFWCMTRSDQPDSGRAADALKAVQYALAEQATSPPPRL